jgi:hypothetical protein
VWTMSVSSSISSATPPAHPKGRNEEGGHALLPRFADGARMRSKREKPTDDAILKRPHGVAIKPWKTVVSQFEIHDA